jgi:hypothetical protein
MTGANFPTVPKKKKARVPERPRWKWADGWRAAAWAALCIEGILAGGDRPCMPSFDVGLLLNHMLKMHLLGIAELLGLCAVIPAFVMAATPKSYRVDPRHRTIIVVALGLAVLVLQLFVDFPAFWVPVLGLAVGLLIRWYDWTRSNWLILAVITAAALGVIQFSGRQYGLNNCWP